MSKLMKTKYFVYTLITCYLVKIGMAVFQDYIVEFLIIDLNMNPIELGLIEGIPNLLILLSVIGLIIKIFRYHGRKDFLNS